MGVTYKHYLAQLRRILWGSMDHFAGFTEEARKLALERFRLIQPHVEQVQSLRAVAQATGLSYRTAQWWVAQYRRFGLAALARKRRDDRGERRAVSAKLHTVIEGLALQKPPLPIAALYRQVQRLSRDLGESAPSYGTVFNIVRGLNAGLVTLAHEGAKAYQVGADLKIRLIFSMPGKPRGRGRIERFFSTLNEMFLCELEGYAPPGGFWSSGNLIACRARSAMCSPSWNVWAKPGPAFAV
jgi:transposase